MNRLQVFQNSPDATKTYVQAIGLLRQIGFDLILLEVANAGDVAFNHPHVVEVNALQNQRRQGFMDAYNFLFDAEKPVELEEVRPAPDFQYAERLLNEGKITRAEYLEYLKDEDNV